MIRRSPLLLALSILIALPLYAAVQPAVTRLLPDVKEKELKGWKLVADARQYVRGEGLTEIYNGGYKEYINAGVVDAAKDLYQRDGDIVEVTAHTMKSVKVSSDFFQKETKSMDRKRVVKTTTATTAVNPGNYRAMAYGQAGIYYITISTMYGGAKSEKDAALFLKLAMKKADVLNKQDKKR